MGKIRRVKVKICKKCHLICPSTTNTCPGPNCGNRGFERSYRVRENRIGTYWEPRSVGRGRGSLTGRPNLVGGVGPAQRGRWTKEAAARRFENLASRPAKQQQRPQLRLRWTTVAVWTITLLAIAVFIILPVLTHAAGGG